MTFYRATIKRFNETADHSIPPPGAYDPKFETDVGVIATKNGGGSEKLSRNNNGAYAKSRSEDTVSSRQISRNSSYTRRSVMAISATDARKRGPFVAKKTSGNIRSRTNSRTSTASIVSVTRRASNNNKKTLARTTCTASSSSSSCAARRNPEVNDEETAEGSDGEVLPELDNRKSSNKSIASCKGDCDNDGKSCQTVIQEIQNMAQSLQCEVAESTRRLACEIIRNKELEAKKLELEYTIKSLMREQEKHESSKRSWEETDSLHQTKIEELNVKTAELEQQIDDLQAKRTEMKENEERLTEKIAKLIDDKVLLQNEKLKLEMELEDLQSTLEKEEKKRLDAEERCKELENQMDSCYQTCESRTADIDNMREVFEVKVQELMQHKEDLLKELDSARRELETQKTLMDLAKNERDEKEKNRQDDYIS